MRNDRFQVTRVAPLGHLTATPSPLHLSAIQAQPGDRLPTAFSDAAADVISPTLAPLAAQLSLVLLVAGVLIFVLAALVQGVHR